MYEKNMKSISVVMFMFIFYFTLSTAMAFDIQWYGQSAFKIETPGGKIILIDPFITKNPATPEKLKDLNKIGNIDLILVTHGHGDHVGDTAQLSDKTGVKVALNADMGHTFAALGWVPYERLIRFNKSGPIMPIGSNIKIIMIVYKKTPISPIF